ncbi:Chromosome-associated kinesin KIF4A [Stylophora pistillata]|uniref:Chromosome-associated kinesin KIF4A n=2 Tax=Stylophora pistillata TaxID=50429 RepID=A0A2B4SDT7_STYPI|nr:Chromosome-associated kinesin KIF4A [Stylophora pistillata]
MGTAFTTCNETSEERGVIPRLIETVFHWINERKEKTEFLLKASFLEIHNEEIHDLLNPCPPDESKIAIRETHDGGIKIAGLQEVVVTSGADMVRCLEQGSASRATGATAMNSRSSRSHAIFTITLEQKKLQGSELKKAKFHLVDLAGSERVKKTHAQGERFKEGVNINKGLLALGNVISALSDELRKSNAHVPYRDSKLTRLLQDSLGGNSNTLMIACVSPADSNFEETLNTLRYADRARQIKNKPIVNLDPAAAELARLRHQVQLLQVQLLQGQTITGVTAGGTSDENTSAINIQEMTDRITELESENEKLSSELHASVDQNTQMYEKVLVAELARDKMLRKFNELKGHFSAKITANVAESVDNSQADMALAEELQTKLHELEESLSSTTKLEDVVKTEEQPTSDTEHPDECDESSDPRSPSDASFVSQHALRRAELGRQLQELNKALALKEELANKMVSNDERLSNMRKQYEDTVRELEGEISRLEKEKASLSVALTSKKSEASDSKMNEKNRNRIKELEAKISDLKKKQVEQHKLLKMKEQSDCTIKKLNSEIQGMKSIRVKLMRQIKEESERFRALKAQKDKEINQLKDQGRKRQFEYKKLENIHQKQQAVLKRKTEEVSAVQKRLKMALDRQKEAAEKKSMIQQQQQKQAEGLVPRMKSWLCHEVEVLVSVNQARQTLENLIDDRKVLSRQLAELRSQEEDQHDEPAAKKMLQEAGTPSDKKNKSHSLQITITTLEHELELRSSQIGVLQQKILDAEQGEKSRHRWNNIHSMAEAKAGLQVLLNMTVAATLANTKTEKSREEFESQLNELRSREESMSSEHQAEMKRIQRSHDDFVTRLKEEHEEKVQCLLQQIPSSDASYNSQQETTEELQEQLGALKEENNNLKEQLRQLRDVFASDSPSPKPKKQKSKKKTVEVLQHDEDWAMDLSEESEQEDLVELDPDWVKTPVGRRPQRRSGRRTQSADASSLIINSGQGQGCKCTGKCATSNCLCKKSSTACSDECGCKALKCVNRQLKSLPEVPTVDIGTLSENGNASSPPFNNDKDGRQALVELKNVSQETKKEIKKTVPLSLKQNGTENQLVTSTKPKVLHKPYSSSSVSSSDEDGTQSKHRGFSRPGSTPGRSVPGLIKSRAPGFSFGSAKKIVVNKPITKFNHENKRKRKLLKPSNTAVSLGAKP